MPIDTSKTTAGKVDGARRAELPASIPLLDRLTAAFGNMRNDPAVSARVAGFMAGKDEQLRALGRSVGVVVDVAKSSVKETSALAMGKAVGSLATLALDRLDAALEGKGLPKQVVVVGFGAVGKEIAAEAKKRGYAVTIHDPAMQRAGAGDRGTGGTQKLDAQVAGYAIATDAASLQGASAFIDATGFASADLKSLMPGAVGVSGTMPAAASRARDQVGALIDGFPKNFGAEPQVKAGIVPLDDATVEQLRAMLAKKTGQAPE